MMIRFLTTRFLLISFLCALLTACATPREQKTPPPGAYDLAKRVLPERQTNSPANQALPPELDPGFNPTPRQEVNQTGRTPSVRPVSAPNLSPLPKHFGPGAPVILNFEQVELRQILEELADLMGLSLVIDSSIGDKVTLRTAADKPLTPEDIWPLFQLLLTEYNIIMEKKGGVYHIKKTQNALPYTIGGKHAALENSTDPAVLQITPLRYIAVDAALAALKPIVEPEGRIVSLPTLNVIGVISSPSRLMRVNSLINLLDADPFVHRGMRLFRLQNSKAEEVHAELDKILQAVEGNQPTYQLIALERINGILVVSPPNRGFAEVARWVAILDEKNEEGGEQVFIYRVRNMEAGKLASTLSEVFESDDKDDKVPRQNNTDPQLPITPPTDQNQTEPEPATPVQREGALQVSAELKVNIVADEDSNSLIIRARPRDYRQLLETIAQLDTVPKEVMVNVVIAEVSLTESTRFGIDWQALLGKKLSERRRTQVAHNIAGVAADTAGFVIDYAGNAISAILNTIATDNDVQVLSRPSILVRNNQEASMTVGSEEPTITRLNTTSQNVASSVLTTSNEVQYRNTGIILKVKPHINEDGIINMEVSQEVSAVGEERTDQNLPSFKTRKFETSLLVRDGNAIILGGFIETRLDNNLSGIPYLMDAPIVGNVFSSRGNDMSRVELVVIIVPELIDPEADNRAYMEAFTRRMQAVENVLNEENIPLIDFWPLQRQVQAAPPAQTEVVPVE